MDEISWRQRDPAVHSASSLSRVAIASLQASAQKTHHIAGVDAQTKSRQGWAPALIGWMRFFSIPTQPKSLSRPYAKADIEAIERRFGAVYRTKSVETLEIASSSSASAKPDRSEDAWLLLKLRDISTEKSIFPSTACGSLTVSLSQDTTSYDARITIAEHSTLVE